MTAFGIRDVKFAQLTRLRRVGARYFLVGRDALKVQVAEYTDGVPVVIGESETLEAPARDVASPGSMEIFVLTDKGVQVATLADNPVVDDTHEFNPGDGRWVISEGSYILAPVAGGVQVLDPEDGQISVSLPGMASCVEAALNADDYLCVADQERCRLYLFQYDSGEIQYVNYFPAPNCRDVLRVVAETGRFIIACKRRISVFDLANDELTHAGTIVLSEDLTDFVPVTGGYWLGFTDDSDFNPFATFFGRQIGMFDSTVPALVVASPEFSHVGSTNDPTFITTAAFDDLIDEDSPSAVGAEDL